MLQVSPPEYKPEPEPGKILNIFPLKYVAVYTGCAKKKKDILNI